MKKPKILVVGSFVMDQIVTTDVFPRQGQTVLAKTFRKAPGGKGANQAVQMARLGADVTMFGKLGKDANGQEMLTVCRKAGICTDFVCYDETQASGCAVIILEEKEGQSTENRIMVVPGSNMTITEADLSAVKADIVSYSLLVLQLEIPMEINVSIAKSAYEAGVPVMLNPAPSAELPPELLRYVTYISPNEHEAYDLTGVEIPHDQSFVDLSAVQRAAKVLQDKGVSKVLVTVGSAGAVLVDGEKTYFSKAVEGVQAVDPTAAGDSFIGAFCTAISGGTDYEEALRFANHTAAITVSRMGAMPSLPMLSEVQETLSINRV